MDDLGSMIHMPYVTHEIKKNTTHNHKESIITWESGSLDYMKIHLNLT